MAKSVPEGFAIGKSGITFKQLKVMGHQSLLVKCDDDSKLMLIGDVIYMPEALEYEPAVPEYAERPEYFASMHLLRNMRSSGVKLCFGHALTLSSDRRESTGNK